MIQIKLREVKEAITHHLSEKYGTENLAEFQNRNGKTAILVLSAEVIDALNKALVDSLAKADHLLAEELNIPVK